MQTHLLEQASQIIISPQLLVNVVSKRVRQLTNGHRPLVEVLPRMGFADVALSEVIQGKLLYEFSVGPLPGTVLPRVLASTQSIGGKQAA